MKSILLIIITLCIFNIQEGIAQTDNSVYYELGYVKFQKVNVSGVHMGSYLFNLGAPIGMGASVDVFSKNGLTLGIIDANINYYLGSDDNNFKLFPYAGLSLATISGDSSTPYEFDIESTKFGFDAGITGIVFIDSFSISASYGYNSTVNLGLFRISAGYNF